MLIWTGGGTGGATGAAANDAAAARARASAPLIGGGAGGGTGARGSDGGRCGAMAGVADAGSGRATASGVPCVAAFGAAVRTGRDALSADVATAARRRRCAGAIGASSLARGVRGKICDGSEGTCATMPGMGAGAADGRSGKGRGEGTDGRISTAVSRGGCSGASPLVRWYDGGGDSGRNVCTGGGRPAGAICGARGGPAARITAGASVSTSASSAKPPCHGLDGSNSAARRRRNSGIGSGSDDGPRAAGAIARRARATSPARKAGASPLMPRPVRDNGAAAPD